MQIFTVDCFSDRPFSGNPNAVCLLSSAWPKDEWLQQLAGEVNLPATAFVRQIEPLPELRWFSPHSELKLCGSGTLAAAHILDELGTDSATMTFATCAGQLGAHREPDQRITLNFPADDPQPIPVPPTIPAALGITPVAAARGRYDFLAQLDSLEAVSKLEPDLAAVAALDTRGLIVTAAGGKDSDFVSRYFAPGAGIDEDPVTASAHCTLGAYWSEKLNKTVMTGRQLSARGGRVDMRLRGSRVDLSGRAVTVTRGELVIKHGSRPN
jgi:PhzF family phenazine biosynthesis protein